MSTPPSGDGKGNLILDESSIIYIEALKIDVINPEFESIYGNPSIV
jgi:hypothetical protein